MTTRLRHRIAAARRVRSLSAREVWELVRAQWHLLVARIRVLSTRRGELLATVPGPEPGGSSEEADLERGRRLALAVDRAAEHGLFHPTCLVRSIALERLLEREKLEGAVLRIGVREDERGIEAHAWIEVGGEVVGDESRHTATFTPLDAFTTRAGP